MKKNKCICCCVGLEFISSYEGERTVSEDSLSDITFGNFIKFDYCPHCGHKVVINFD